MKHVDVIMSFDLWSMHELKRTLLKTFPSSGSYSGNESRHGTHFHIDEKALVSSPRLSTSNLTNLLHTKYHDVMNHHGSDIISNIPKVMLLTVSDPPKNNFELWVDVNDYTPIDSWLKTDESHLDGVYVKFQDEMRDSDGAESLRTLSEKTTVGVWGKYGKDPDDYETMEYLVSCGVSYYNTDLPRTFLERTQQTIKYI